MTDVDILKKALEGKYTPERAEALLKAKAEASWASAGDVLGSLIWGFVVFPLALWWGWDGFLVPVAHVAPIGAAQAWAGGALLSVIRATLRAPARAATK